MRRDHLCTIRWLTESGEPRGLSETCTRNTPVVLSCLRWSSSHSLSESTTKPLKRRESPHQHRMRVRKRSSSLLQFPQFSPTISQRISLPVGSRGGPGNDRNHLCEKIYRTARREPRKRKDRYHEAIALRICSIGFWLAGCSTTGNLGILSYPRFRRHPRMGTELWASNCTGLM